ncbi:glycogen debranching protein [Hydrococcus rivularis NIES-593]|uniref:Glycogen debranching protein n=1 Tax=Hydrococcus rivularis NIES-593 TaxID=1921803 RepID=A0A1U7HQZ8_9CYAN|nr:amylo-alpha-1,6-glucosidase [Hydrococcus rivularis]OKH25955.1 glycogen debranching protein [Hydrococcus rivularis NIES-593]
MRIDFGREICSDLNALQTREWLVTNGIGGYASGTLANWLTRGYHGILVAALKPPLERTLLVSKIDDTAYYNGLIYPLFTNNWINETVDPQGYRYLDSFSLEGTIPLWRYRIEDVLLEKRIWMQPGSNTTYIYYRVYEAAQPLSLSLKVLVNYRDYHSRTRAGNWRMHLESIARGVRVNAFPNAVPYYILADRVTVSPVNEWYYGFELERERDRGLDHFDDNLYAVKIATYDTALEPGQSLTVVATTESNPDLDGIAQLEVRRAYEQRLLETWQVSHPTAAKHAPEWVKQLVLDADRFIVNRPLPDNPDGKTIIAGYHWFTDWGRDTMISLPGLTLSTGRSEIARSIIRTFAQYISQGMLPNHFPDDNKPLSDGDYNTVDATLWYFEAIRSYYEAKGDEGLLQEIFPKLAEIIDWHRRGTRYNIHLDAHDGLLYAGTPGVQLTWMDAKVEDWVVTPRIGKPVEINALWYNALRTLSKFAQQLGQPYQEYDNMAQATLIGFQRFWNEDLGYCFDVLDTPEGNDASLRPNQIFAVSLPESPLTPIQQRKIVEICDRLLLTPYGLRSLTPDNPQYQGYYKGDRIQRDGAYHQGTVWGWLLGAYVMAHLRVFNDPLAARRILEPMANHILEAGVGSISEIFDGNAPFAPKGCIAQAWSVAEVLRAWLATESVIRE